MVSLCKTRFPYIGSPYIAISAKDVALFSSFLGLKSVYDSLLEHFALVLEHFQHRFPKLTAKTLLCALSRHLPYIAFCLPDGCSRIVIFSVALFQIFSTARKAQSV